MRRPANWIVGIWLLLCFVVITPGPLSRTIFQASNECYGDIPIYPALNALQISYTPNATCIDLALIDGKVIEGGERDGHYAESSQEHAQGIVAQVGQTVAISLYFADDEFDRGTGARDLKARISFANQSPSSVLVRGYLQGDDAGEISSVSHGGDLLVRFMQPGAMLRYIPGSTTKCVTSDEAKSQGEVLATHCGRDKTAGTILMGDGIAERGVLLHGGLKPGFAHSGTVEARFEVVKE